MLDLAPVTTMLMPHVFASISNLVRSDPHCAVQVLSLIRAMLPSVASLNNLAAARNLVNGDAAAADSDDDMDDAGNQVRTIHNYPIHYRVDHLLRERDMLIPNLKLRSAVNLSYDLGQ